MNSLTDHEKIVLQAIYNSLLTNPRILRQVALLTENLIYQRGDIGKSKYYVLNELDRKIEQYIDIDNGYFVELGANDGVSQSNTLYFEKSRAWTLKFDTKWCKALIRIARGLKIATTAGSVARVW